MSRTSTMLFLTEDYADRLDALYREAREAEDESEKAAKSRRMLDSSRLDAARAAFNALKAEAEKKGTRVTVRSLGRREWRVLKQVHPPRSDTDPEVVKQDRLAGVNVETVEDDLVHAALVAPSEKACAGDQPDRGALCTTANPCSSRVAYESWVNDLPEADFQAALARAWSLVNVARTDPKSLPASPTQNSDAN